MGVGAQALAATTDPGGQRIERHDPCLGGYQDPLHVVSTLISRKMGDKARAKT